MKSYQLFILLSLVTLLNAGSFRNNTVFWQTKTNVSDIHFQAYSGYEEIDWYYPRGSSNMFYTLFGAFGRDVKTEDSRIPLLVWLQGGPGSSSQFGAFTEIGPISITKDKITLRDTAWNAQGHYLFIDSPLNVGFSYQGDRKGEAQVSSASQATDHLMNFLSNFYQTWPNLKKSPLYITGESFGGHYVPSLGKKLLNNKTFIEKTGVKLAGVAIGDGWTDPINQINYYDSYLWSVGVVDSKFRDVLTWYQTNSIINIYNGDYKNATAYFDFITNNDTTPQVYFGGISIFNFRNYDGLDQTFAKFLSDNKAEFGATVEYIPGNEFVYTAFGADISKSYAQDVIDILGQAKVLIYNGQDDVVVNTPGVLQYINSLNWNGIAQWKRSQKKIWTIHGEVRGWAKVSGNLWFALVNGAGHMVPTDQPSSAFNLIGHFLKDNREWQQ